MKTISQFQILLIGVLLAMFSLAQMSFAHTTSERSYTSRDQTNDPLNHDCVFPGGTKALAKFIDDNLTYPSKALKEGIQGRVILRLTIEKSGEISNIEVARKLTPECDKEAIRIAKMMPMWTPAKKDGYLVRSICMLPISFISYNGNYEENKAMLTSTESNEKDIIMAETPSWRTAQFPGGEEERSLFMAQNLVYPTEAQEQGIEGRVVARITVGKDGSITKVAIVKGISPECDNEVIRVIKTMPKWIPGEENGEKVTEDILLPVDFKISGR